MLVKLPGHGTAAGRVGSALLESLAAQLAAIQLQGFGQQWDAIKIKAAVAELDQGDAVGSDAELIGDFSLGEVQFLAAVTDEAAEVAFETFGHDGFLLGRTEQQLRPETIIEEAAGPTKEDCYIDDISGSVLQRDSRESPYLHDGQR